LRAIDTLCVPRVPADEKVRRDALVVADRARGLTWPTIAARHDLSERQCRSVYSEFRGRADREAEDPEDEARDAVRLLEAVVEELALLSETTNNDAVQLGAIRTKLDAMCRRIELMQALGLLPRDLGLFEDRRDGRLMASALLSVLERHHVSPEAEDEMLEALQVLWILPVGCLPWLQHEGQSRLTGHPQNS
jgi:hypothetical protein